MRHVWTPRSIGVLVTLRNGLGLEVREIAKVFGKTPVAIESACKIFRHYRVCANCEAGYMGEHVCYTRPKRIKNF